MAITKPELSTKMGYVEEEIDGKRVYRSTETGYILGEEPEAAPTAADQLRADIDYISVMTGVSL